MTNKELQEKIVRLESELIEMRKKAEMLSKGGIFKPKNEQDYWLISGYGEVSQVKWCNRMIDYQLYAIGNCYQTRQSAEDTVRAQKLIQKAKESQGEFMPDWEDWEQEKYYLYFEDNAMRTGNNFSMNTAPIFGYWKEKEMCKKFIRENHHELIWFFTEHRK